MNFVFWDTETTGINTQFDQILQFAAILTDENLQELERFELRCRLERHVVPSAKALQVTGQSIADITDPSRCSHYQMMTQIRSKLEDWSPAIFVGWNTIGFDEPLLQQAFFKALHPPYVTVTNGNERVDAMKLAQCLEAFGSNALTVPVNDKGKPVYKLDQLAPANGFPHLNAHDALADVEATIFIAQKIKNSSPEAWDLLCHCGSKHRVIDQLRNNPVCLYRDSFFGSFYEFAVCRIASDGFGAEICFDLRHDPAGLTHLGAEDLARFVKRTPKPLRTIRPNKAPLVSPLNPNTDFGDVAYNTLLERAGFLQENAELVDALVAAVEREPFPPGIEVEERIFDGFPSTGDQALMDQFHQVDWPSRVDIAARFSDDRFQQIAQRVLIADAEALLPDALREDQLRHEARRLLGIGTEDPAWLTLQEALDECTQLQSDCEPSEAAMLAEFQAYIEQRMAHARAILN